MQYLYSCDSLGDKAILCTSMDTFSALQQESWDLVDSLDFVFLLLTSCSEPGYKPLTSVGRFHGI